MRVIWKALTAGAFVIVAVALSQTNSRGRPRVHEGRRRGFAGPCLSRRLHLSRRESIRMAHSIRPLAGDMSRANVMELTWR